jgi:hypothetical protein
MPRRGGDGGEASVMRACESGRSNRSRRSLQAGGRAAGGPRGRGGGEEPAALRSRRPGASGERVRLDGRVDGGARRNRRGAAGRGGEAGAGVRSFPRGGRGRGAGRSLRTFAAAAACPISAPHAARARMGDSAASLPHVDRRCVQRRRGRRRPERFRERDRDQGQDRHPAAESASWGGNRSRAHRGPEETAGSSSSSLPMLQPRRREVKRRSPAAGVGPSFGQSG